MTKNHDIKQSAMHTPEPWSCDGSTTLYATPDESDEMTMIEVNANITEAGWDTVAFIEAIWPGAHANARRICAAVNACEGISTEALEQGVVAELLSTLTDFFNIMHDYESSVEKGYVLQAMERSRATIEQATGRVA